MKRFEFKLQALLNYKRHLEQLAQRDLADAQAAVKACEQRIRDLHDARRASVIQLDTRVAEGINASEFQSHQGFIQGVTQTIGAEEQNKKALEKRLDEKRGILKQRTIDKKAIEQLREKRLREHVQEMLRLEQKDLDEICAIKSAREALNENA